MSETPVTPAVPAAPAPKKLNAIEIIEQEIVNFIRQREEAIAKVHAIEGAIQAAQHLAARLKAEAIKAETEAKKLAGEVETEVGKVVEFVKKEI